jgi:hypothetical protein
MSDYSSKSISPFPPGYMASQIEIIFPDSLAAKCDYVI